MYFVDVSNTADSAAGTSTQGTVNQLVAFVNTQLPVASAGTLGVVRVGSGLSIDGSGILSATGGGGVTIGGTVTGGTATRLLFVGTGGTLTQDAALTTTDQAPFGRQLVVSGTGGGSVVLWPQGASSASIRLVSDTVAFIDLCAPTDLSSGYWRLFADKGSGYLDFGGTGSYRFQQPIAFSGPLIGNARVCVTCPAPDRVGVVVRGGSSQTANLTEWQNSAGSVLAAILASGGFSPAQLADSAAANGTLYYSTTVGKLAFKDLAGTVRTFY